MKRVLIVDDDRLVLSALERALRRRFDVAIAVGGENALRMLDDFQPDLVIADAAMPGMDGVAVLAAVQRRLPDCKRMILTGTNDQEAIEAVESLKGIFRAWKPWDNAQLLAQLSEILD